MIKDFNETDRAEFEETADEAFFGEDAGNEDYGFEDVAYDEQKSPSRPSNKYEGMNAYSSESEWKYCGPLVADTMKGISFAELLEKHGMTIKYSDERYSELFEKLKKGIEENHEIDEDVFNDIFFGKITPIAKNCYNSFKCSFVCEHVNDIFNEAYMLIYKKSIHHFFLRPDEEGKEPMEKDEISYLKWCKTCILNSIRSKLRGRNKIDLVQLRYDSGDSEDDERTDPSSNLPSTNPTPEQIAIERSMITEMFRYVARLRSKPEKKLMWFAIQLYILNGSATDKIAANHFVYEECASMTLSEFASFVLDLLDGVGWMKINSAERQMLCSGVFENGAKSEKCSERLSVLVAGDNDEESAFLKKISDWVFKINSSLSRMNTVS